VPEWAPQVIVIAGPNGAGKTSAARDLLRDTVGIDAFVNADVVAQGLSGFRPESAAAEAGRAVWKRLHALAKARADFALESTLSGRSLATFLRKLATTGYERHILYLWLPSVDLSIERVRVRVQAGGHDVPEGAIRRRFPRSLKNFFEIYVPISSSWRVYDGTGGPHPRLIAFGRGSSTIQVLEPQTWALIKDQV